MLTTVFVLALVSLRLVTASINTTVECIPLSASSSLCAYHETSSETYDKVSFSVKSIFVEGVTSGVDVSLTQVSVDTSDLNYQFQHALTPNYVFVDDTGFAAEILFEDGNCFAQNCLA